MFMPLASQYHISGKPMARPAAMPTSARSTDSHITMDTTLDERIPSARMRPSSRVRSKVAMSMVLTMPRATAKKMMTNMITGITSMAAIIWASSGASSSQGRTSSGAVTSPWSVAVSAVTASRSSSPRSLTSPGASAPMLPLSTWPLIRAKRPSRSSPSSTMPATTKGSSDGGHSDSGMSSPQSMGTDTAMRSPTATPSAEAAAFDRTTSSARDRKRPSRPSRSSSSALRGSTPTRRILTGSTVASPPSAASAPAPASGAVALGDDRAPSRATTRGREAGTATFAPFERASATDARMAWVSSASLPPSSARIAISWTWSSILMSLPR